MKECTLEIPINEESVILLNRDGVVLFEGDEVQASRISNIIPPVAGGCTHRHLLSGLYEQENDSIVVKIQDGFELNSVVEVEIVDCIIKRVSVCWP
ncbi:hypothetical protein [Photobacterium sp. 53610]|uniref:hypothetical protein n=1 Tax=Photobacterium sp. 53610 TaxID=3102789 RepID=UPI002EDB0B2F